MLIDTKDGQIKRLDEDYCALESKKSDRYRDLSTIIHKSFDKISSIKVKQEEEMAQFEDTEVSAIEEKKKRLHFECIRIEETKKELESERESVE